MELYNINKEIEFLEKCATGLKYIGVSFGALLMILGLLSPASIGFIVFICGIMISIGSLISCSYLRVYSTNSSNLITNTRSLILIEEHLKK